MRAVRAGSTSVVQIAVDTDKDFESLQEKVALMLVKRLIRSFHFVSLQTFVDTDCNAS